MATIRQLRGRWQAMVRRRGVPPRCKSFDKRSDATPYQAQRAHRAHFVAPDFEFLALAVRLDDKLQD